MYNFQNIENNLAWSSGMVQAGAGVVAPGPSNLCYPSICDTGTRNFYNDAIIPDAWPLSEVVHFHDKIQVYPSSGPDNESQWPPFCNAPAVYRQQQTIEQQTVGVSSLSPHHSPFASANISPSVISGLFSCPDTIYSCSSGTSDAEKAVSLSGAGSATVASPRITTIAPQGPEFPSLVHGGVKYYCCLKCRYETRRKTDMVRHQQSLTHSARRQYRCSRCGKEYTRKDGLKRHGRSHSHEIIR